MNDEFSKATDYVADWISAHRSEIGGVQLRFIRQEEYGRTLCAEFETTKHLIQFCAWDHASCLDILAFGKDTGSNTYMVAGDCDGSVGLLERLERFLSWLNLNEPMRRRAVFLDRDGVLNRSVVREGLPCPPASLAEFEFYDDVPAGCARLKEAGFLLVVATNQPDVGRGTQSREVVDAMHAALCKALPIDRVAVCFHPGGGSGGVGVGAGEGCDCRKPAPGMLLRAAAALGIDLRASFMIGDRWRDVDCGHAAGCRTVFLDRGYQEALRQPPDWTVGSFAEAVEAVLKAEGRRQKAEG